MALDLCSRTNLCSSIRLCLQTLASIQRLSTALNILEKYGCNLTNPTRPKYWRTVKLNNPVFRSTVDAIQVSSLCEFLEEIRPTQSAPRPGGHGFHPWPGVT